MLHRAMCAIILMLSQNKRRMPHVMLMSSRFPTTHLLGPYFKDNDQQV